MRKVNVKCSSLSDGSANSFLLLLLQVPPQRHQLIEIANERVQNNFNFILKTSDRRDRILGTQTEEQCHGEDCLGSFSYSFMHYSAQSRTEFQITNRVLSQRVRSDSCISHWWC